MKNSLETRLGIFFVLAMFAAVLLLETIGGARLFRRGEEVYTHFDTVKELKVGDPVRMAGVRVGSVAAFTLTNGQVRVALQLDKNHQVRTDSKATILFTSLLGQNYLNVDFGSPSAAPAGPGTVLAAEEQPDFNQLLAKLNSVAEGVEEVTRTFSGESMQGMLGPIGDFVRDNSGKLGRIFDNVDEITAQVASGNGTLGKIINDDALYTEALGTFEKLGSSAGEIQGLVTNANDVINMAKGAVQNVKDGKGTLGLLTTDETLYRETTTAMTNLREIMEKVNTGQGTLGKIVNDENFLSTLKLTLQKVEKATDSIEDQGPLSVIGLAAGSLF